MGCGRRRCRRQELVERSASGGPKSRPMTQVSGNASSAGNHAAKASSSTSTFTEASDRMKNCSATASRQFSGTSMAPSRAQA